MRCVRLSSTSVIPTPNGHPVFTGNGFFGAAVPDVQLAPSRILANGASFPGLVVTGVDLYFNQAERQARKRSPCSVAAEFRTPCRHTPRAKQRFRSRLRGRYTPTSDFLMRRAHPECVLPYRFEEFILDRKTRDLQDGAESIHLEPQAFDVLVFLIENRDRVVSKIEMLDTIWQGRVVSESALTSRIKSIRRALNDDGKSQRLIRNFPNRGYRFMGAIESESSVDGPSPSLTLTRSAQTTCTDSPSLAILPFEVFGEDVPKLTRFADGLVEDLTTLITRIPLLSVTARTSTFALREEKLDARQAGDRLGARYIVEGSVQDATKGLRVNVQLIDSDSGFHVWAEHFNRGESEEDSEKLLLRLAARLELHLVHAIHRAVLAQGGELSAVQLLVQASTLLATDGWHRDTFQEAVELLERSISLDPSSALAHAELGLSLALGHRVGLLERSSTLVQKAVAEAESPFNSRGPTRTSWVA